MYGAIHAVEDVVARHKSRQSETGSFRGSIINMSFQVRNDEQFRDAVRSAYAAGIVMVASAGNSNDDLATVQRYPAKYTNVITVAASNDLYKKHYTSSYGRLVDIIAPGAGIESDWYVKLTRSLIGSFESKKSRC